jgi:hypothetical protein
VVLAGLGHTIGSLVEAAPSHVDSWFDGSLWSERDYAAQSDAAAGFWYSVFSFGPPMLLLGVLLLWLDQRGLTPPPFVPWAIATWVTVTFVASGPSPLPLLLVAAVMMLIASRRQPRSESPRH